MGGTNRGRCFKYRDPAPSVGNYPKYLKLLRTLYVYLMVDLATARSKVLLSECFERKIKSPFLQFWHLGSKI